MYVAAFNDETGVQAWKRVEAAFFSGIKDTYDLTLAHTEDGATRVETLGVTEEHPFWVDRPGDDELIVSALVFLLNCLRL